MNIWELDKLYLFIMFVVPGFVAIKAYELIFPTQPKDSSKQIIDAVTYSCINYALVFFFIQLVEKSNIQTSNPNWYAIFYFLVLFVSPVFIVLLWKKIRSTDWAQKNAPHPTEKPWDYIFAQRKPYWVKITLKDGTIIGGLYSTKSFASSSPATEQIYLEQTWVIDSDGAFKKAKADTAGVIILSNEISHLELREVRS